LASVVRLFRHLLPNPPLCLPVQLEQVPIITVLGMHRSGTSVVTGMLEENGLYLGPVRRQGNPNQPKGNRENPEVSRLDQRVLAYNGGTWWRPPLERRIKFTRRHLQRRNEILADYGRTPFAIKDPRMLLLLDFWRDALGRPIGVIRNPVSVMRSLRSRGGRTADFSDDEHLGLWKAYNRRLLDELRKNPFPVVDFERRESLSKQVIAAIRHHGIALSTPPEDEDTFFEPGAVRHNGGLWRDDIRDPEVLELWDELVSYAEYAG
jgi:hypothetical protein